MSSSPFNLQTLNLDKERAKITIFAEGRYPKKMREYPTQSKILGFIQNNMGIVLQGNPRYEWMSTCKTELDMIKSYYQNYDRDSSCFIMAHSLSKLKWGRTMCANNLSLNIMHRPTRHALCNGIYVDKDMHNAHVAILCETFKFHDNIDISALVEYNSDPKKWRAILAEHHGLDPIKNKDTTKQLFIRILFGGSYEQWIKDFDIETNTRPEERHPLVLSIENQLVQVREAFYKANPQMERDLIKHDPVKYKDVHQLKRSLLAFALQTIERWIMEECVRFLVEEKGFALTDVVPCQDGFMFKRELNYEGCESDLERITLEKFGLKIGWVDKEFDEAIEIPDGVVSRSFDEWLILLSDTGLSKQVLATHGHRIRYKRATSDSKDMLYVFDSDKKRWFLEDTKKPHTLLNIIESQFPCVKNEIDDDDSLKESERKLFVGRLIISLQNNGGINNVLKRLLDRAEWCDCGFDSVPYYLGFENGFVDLRSGEFSEYREDIYITITTGYNYRKPDYESADDFADREEVSGIFESMFRGREEMYYYLQIMASGLDAVNYQYIWFFEGAGGNGKGLGLGLNEIVLGDRFYKPAKGGILAADSEKANQSSEDMAALKDARMVVFNEMDKNGGMTWSALKSLTGGETISARRLYQGLMTFRLSASFIGAFNNKPDMVGHIVGAERASLERRLKPLHFPFLFTTDEDKIAEGKNYRRANQKFESADWRNKVRDVYLDLLIGVYSHSYCKETGCIKFEEPASIKAACSDYLRDENLFLEIFNDLYKADETRKEDIKANRLYVGDLYNLITSHELFKEGSSGNGKKAFLRTWSKKAFTGWCRDAFDSKIDSAKGKEYIVGYISLDSLEDELLDVSESGL